MTSRSPPVNPNRNVPNSEQTQSGRPVQRSSRIEKTSQVDEDRMRQRKFRDMVDQPEEEPSSQPSPFELFNSSQAEESSITADSSLQDALNDAVVPGASSSPPPAQILAGTTGSDSPEESSLPQSNLVWSHLDEPPAASQPQFNLQETTRSRENNTDSSQSDSDESQEQNTLPFASSDLKKHQKNVHQLPPPPPQEKNFRAKVDEKGPLDVANHNHFSSVRGETQHLSEPSASQSLHMPLEEPKKGIAKQTDITIRDAQIEKTAMYKEMEEKETSYLKNVENIEKKEFAHKKGQESISHKQEEKEKRDEGDQKKGIAKEKVLQMQTASLLPIDPSAIPVAQAAVQAAAPYLGTEALAIYFHMIGSIVAMVKPSGDSRTEILLNSPSFEKSKFFGSKITIERFSTAPYMLNIRLGGATESAVKDFEQNIPNLLTAFRAGNFAFTINRIETAFEKPLFHRKGSAKDKGTSSDTSER